jgi:hypothetical protein
VATSAQESAQGGPAGIGTNGNFNTSGAPGAWGAIFNSGFLGGNGGSSHYGGGGLAPYGASVGTAAGAYGSGGSGAVSTTTSSAGGAGSAGLIIIWEFC